jgi:hypothetical protein
MDLAHSFCGSVIDSIIASWAISSIAKKAQPSKFHKRATAAITQYQKGTADLVFGFIASLWFHGEFAFSAAIILPRRVNSRRVLGRQP